MTEPDFSSLERDFIGYGRQPKIEPWPNGARIAVNICVNYEEGSEQSVPDGYDRSEGGLTESRALECDGRDLAAESMFEYGSRAGIWRILRILEDAKVPATIFACALALERNREVGAAISELGYDICAHGWRWEYHSRLTMAQERSLIAKSYASIEAQTGIKPAGWYCRYGPSLNTRSLIVEHGGFLYDSDAYNDDLPYWRRIGECDHLIIPYGLVCNDANFMRGGMATADQFYSLLKDTFDMLYSEGESRPAMMSVGLHPRIIGHPGRAAGLQRFVEYVSNVSGAWICRRSDIAAHWHHIHRRP